MKRIIFVLSALFFTANAVFAVYGETALYAGAGSYHGDGSDISMATLSGPADAVINTKTNVMYVADTLNHVIRQVDLGTGIITTLAGSGTAGYQEDTGAAALFNTPYAICFDEINDMLYVADTNNNRIRRIDVLTGTTEHVGGNQYVGILDGNTSTARFYYPRGVAIDTSANSLYVSDYGSGRIRKIDMDTYMVSTIAGSSAGYNEGTGTAALFNGPHGLDIDVPGQKLYIADFLNNRVRVLDLATAESSLIAGSTYGYLEEWGPNARFRRPSDVYLDEIPGKLYVTDENNHVVRVIDLAGNTTALIAGSGTAGDAEGIEAAAQFDNPCGLALNPARNIIYLADKDNNKIKAIDLDANSLVSHYGGMGIYDGDGNTIPTATFNNPADVALNTQTGRKYIADAQNHVIRMVDENGVVSTIAGTGSPGYAEGPGLTAQFNSPRSIALDDVRNILYVSDTQNNRIRAIDLDTNEVSLVAGANHPPFYLDAGGANARFYNPEEIDIDIERNHLYVADRRNHRIRGIDLTVPSKTVYHISGIASPGYQERQTDADSAAWNFPEGLIYMKQFDVLMVADTGNNVIRRIGLDPTDEPCTYYTYKVAGSDSLTAGYVDATLDTSLFNAPCRLTYDPLINTLYISDKNNYAVRYAYLVMGGGVATVAGSGFQGYVEGIQTAAQFGSVRGMDMEYDTQTIYIADGGNNRIRTIDVFIPSPTPSVSPTISITDTPTIGDTPTITETHTISPTITETGTITPTHSVTDTYSATPTITQTLTSTATPTITETPSITDTFTASPTSTMTFTDTVTPTVTPTFTQTETFTQTRTYTFTATFTASPTITETFTETFTPTITATPTYTGTDTATETWTHTPTVTETLTITYTETMSPTYTETGTQTYTFTQTPFVSDTVTPTITLSATFTPTVTATYSMTATPTLTLQPTVTVTPTSSETATAQPTWTVTPTASETVTGQPTFTSTPTQQGTPTATLTPTVLVVLYDDTVIFREHYVYPNPSRGRFVLSYNIDSVPASIEYRIYTVADRLIWKKDDFSAAADANIELIDYLEGHASGLYYYVIKAVSDSGRISRAYGHILVIK